MIGRRSFDPESTGPSSSGKPSRPSPVTPGQLHGRPARTPHAPPDVWIRVEPYDFTTKDDGRTGTPWAGYCIACGARPGKPCHRPTGQPLYVGVHMVRLIAR